MENIKSHLYELQKNNFSVYAQLDINSKGRAHEISLDNMRGEYQRDRDRIIHSKAFRRLKHKTQVFLAPEGDHYRTRLTHTLEVAQIARTMARCLRLNEDLVEAISLGHDLGHTPFGHAGERTLDILTRDCGGFIHSKQSRRVAELLENDGVGLNLTYEVLDGMENHRYTDIPCTLEGKIVIFADRFAYINHDIEDAIRGKVLNNDDLPLDCCKILGFTKGDRINNLVNDLVLNSFNKNEIKQSSEFKNATEKLHSFMYKEVYLSEKAKPEEKKATNVLEMVYNYYLNNINEIPDFFKSLLKTFPEKRVVCDYVATFTDPYCLKVFDKIFVPKYWSTN